MPDYYDVNFSRVRFSYPCRNTDALIDINLSLSAGGRLAISGPSGSGKTTVFNLLLRFFDPDEGLITIGGTDLRQMRTEDVLAQFSILSQHPKLFGDTLRNNLLIGRHNADERQLQSAIVAAGLGNFVNDLPGGLDTWLGENGVQVSGGEARRIALARVYLKDAPVLLLDEPTAGLDPVTRNGLLMSLASLMTGKTVLLASHDPKVIQLMDEVLTIECGRIIAHQNIDAWRAGFSG
jgi:ATP-binding cassette subfamily C protein CydC